MDNPKVLSTSVTSTIREIGNNFSKLKPLVYLTEELTKALLFIIGGKNIMKRQTRILLFLTGICVTLAASVAINGQTTSNLEPYVVPRQSWSAFTPFTLFDKSCTQSNGTLTNVFIHHTSSEDSKLEATVKYHEPTWVWSIQQQHMNDPRRLYCDIGYHYLIGPSGTIYEGRQGGTQKKGGHIDAMNTGTVGVAMLGNFDTKLPTPAALLSLQKLLAWLLLNNNLEPEGLNYVTSGKYYSPTISGHREMDWSPLSENHTSCPGNSLYNYLPALRQSMNTRIRNIEKSYLFKTSNSSTVFRVRNYAKRPFTSGFVYNSYFGDQWDYVRIKDASYLNQFTTGSAIPFRDGTLLGYSDQPRNPTIFVVYNGKRRAFRDYNYFLELGGRYKLGYSPDKIMRVPAAVLNGIPMGDDMVNIIQ